MKKTFIYSSIVLLLAAAVACNKTDSPVSEEPIRFAFATDAATRALNTNATEDPDHQGLRRHGRYTLLYR